MKKKLILVGALASAGITVLGVQPAHAWSWDSTVTAKGSAGCGSAETLRVYGTASNGESHVGDFGYGNSYSMTFGRVPSGGESVRFDVYCTVSGHHTSSRWISRPSTGTTQTVNL